MRVTLKEIEQNFQRAVAVDFAYTPDYDKRPPAITLIFKQEDIKSDSPEEIYTHIFNYFNNKDIDERPTFVIRKENDVVHLSIVDKATANSINTYNLTYKKLDLQNFVRKTEKDWAIVFVVGFYTRDGGIMIGRGNDYLLCKGFTVTG